MQSIALDDPSIRPIPPEISQESIPTFTPEAALTAVGRSPRAARPTTAKAYFLIKDPLRFMTLWKLVRFLGSIVSVLRLACAENGHLASGVGRLQSPLACLICPQHHGLACRQCAGHRGDRLDQHSAFGRQRGSNRACAPIASPPAA